MNDYGIKILSLENWLERDPVMASFTKDGFSPAEGADWLERILAIELSKQAPVEVRKLFDVARGTLAYGYFYYPLYSLAPEQLLRVAEAAVKHKAKSYGVWKFKASLHEMINALIKQGAISEADREAWDNLRQARNYTTHADEQMILTPALAINLFASITNRINTLYSAT